MRYQFNQIFQENQDGSLSPRQRVRVAGVIFGNNIKINPGVAFGGVDFHQFKGHDIEAKEEEDLLIITGIY